MDNVHCLNPWDPQSKRQYMIDVVYATLNAGQAIGGQAHGICYCFQQNQREEVRNMGEQAGALTAEPGMHNNNYLCYCIEGNVVDRVSSKNGKGWCEDVSPTLNTQDRHAVVFSYGVISKGNGETILSKEKHMSLSCGGGQAGQGYPAVMYQIGEEECHRK